MPEALAQRAEELRAPRLVAAALAEDLAGERVGREDVDARERRRPCSSPRAAAR